MLKIKKKSRYIFTFFIVFLLLGFAYISTIWDGVLVSDLFVAKEKKNQVEMENKGDIDNTEYEENSFATFIQGKKDDFNIKKMFQWKKLDTEFCFVKNNSDDTSIIKCITPSNVTENFDENLKVARRLIQEASEENLSLVAFPEMFLYIGEDKQKKLQIAETIDGKTIQSFQEDAQRLNISILLGSLYEKVPDEPPLLYNTSILIGRNGEIQGVYRKIHLCDIDSPELKNIESLHIKPGDSPIVVEHEIGKIGLSICYDLRFPGLFQHLTALGAEIIFIPSAFFVETGKDHWFPLLRARAIENQVYIVAPAQCGRHYGQRVSYGNSTLINPWGVILSCAPSFPGLISGRIDLDYLHEVRKNMPVQQHQRYECYDMKNK